MRDQPVTTTIQPVPQTAAPAAADVRPGATVWLTGLPSAGKTTLALALADELRAEGRRVEVLDGDEFRTHLSAGLGFSKEDRHTQGTRIAFVAELLARNGVLALVPVIAPYAQTRDAARQLHDRHSTTYLEVHLSTPLDVCADRDVKGLYGKAARGEISHMTGVDDPYEVPETPDLRLDTSVTDLAGSVQALLAVLTERGVR
jgi:adenylylsulfate kinase